jgi:hypothetical protein
VVSLALLAGTAGAAEPLVTVENIWVGFNNNYKLGTWTPVRVDLQAGPQDFQGALEVIVPDDDGTPTSVFRPVSIPARQTLSFPAYVRPGTRDVEFRVAVRNEGPGGRVLARGVGQQVYTQIETAQSLILTLGNPRGVDEIPKLPGFVSEDRPTQNAVVVTSVQPTALPATWYGYEAVNLVVLDANDREVLRALSQRGEGLRQWVRHGGHLVIAIGSNWQEVNDSPLRDLLPAVPVGRQPLADLGAVESFVGAENKPITPPGSPPVQVTQFELVPARDARGLDSTASGPILVRGHYGFGLVTVVGLDVDSRPFADWVLKNQFWARLLDLRPPSSGAAVGGPSAAILQQNVSDVATLLHSNLEAFQGVKLVPFGWVAFFVFLYILLIGPGDYFFLKKVVKRMELTWISFPLIVVLVSVLAYLGAYAVKGTQMRINKVDAIDLNQSDGLMRGTTWFTVFSPQNRDYNLSLGLLPLDRPAATSPGSPGAAETAAPVNPPDSVLMSWFGAPETSFGGMGNSGGFGGAGSGYRYASLNRQDGQINHYGPPETLSGVRVPIWSTKSATARWLAPAVTAVDADLQISGGDRLAGTLTNRLNVPLRDAYLVHGKYAYRLGDLAPGEVKSLATASDRTLAGYIESLNRALPRVQPWQLGNQPVEVSRASLIRFLMFASSLEGRPGNLASNLLSDLDLTSQLALDRPMLVANLGLVDTQRGAAGDDPQEVAKDAFPVARLNLGELSSTPLIYQTTVLRVILPTPKSQEP